MPRSSELYEWVASAPRPVLTVDGPAAVVSNVRFTWMTYCAWCRQCVHLWADGGSIQVGVREMPPRGKGARGCGRIKNIPQSRWYEIDKPPAKPPVPATCPRCGHDRWTGVIGQMYKPLPVAPAHLLVGKAYDVIRADAALVEQVHRADVAAGIVPRPGAVAS